MKSKAVLAGFLAMGLMGVAPAQERGGAPGDLDAPYPLPDPYEGPDFADTRAQCAAVAGRTPSAADRPDAAARRALAGCDAEALYYGIGRPADPVRARQCAFIQAELGENQAFSGNAMLMTIYANGVGAARDLDVATHLACSLEEDAPAELRARIAHLDAMRARIRPRQDFHYCDDITSGLAMGYCAAHGSRIDEVARSAALAALTADYDPAQRRAYRTLVAARDAFMAARTDGEIDMSGTARGAIWVAARDNIIDDFVQTLRLLAGGRLPTASLAAADRALNAAYAARRRELAAGLRIAGFSDIAPSWNDVRHAQRAWLRYRDAFLAFAAIAYPGVSRDGLAARLTAERTQMLRGEDLVF